MGVVLFPFYTPLEQAAAELRARRATVPLARGDELERYLTVRPYAVLFRQLATPNFELERFVSLSAAVGLTPMILEFGRDKFVTRNPGKYSLARMGFYSGTGRRGGSRVRYLSVADIHAADGRLICEVVTHWGQQLVAFHHELLSSQPALSGLELFDGSHWFHSCHGVARGYYPDLFALFLRHAVLFESFLYTPSERAFTTDVVIPAFENVVDRHGYFPLVCRLDPDDAEGMEYWLHYRDDMRAHVAARLVGR